MQNLVKNYTIEHDYLKQVINYREYSLLISNYFYRYSLEKDSKVLFNNSMQIKNCNKIWDINYYKDLNIKEFKRTFLCHNKFCFNCKKVLQAFRMSKYIPFIKQQKNLYHLVLTVPNVQGEDLKSTLKQMAKAFRRFYSIINNRDKFKLPFSGFECIGAIRSLEITFNEKGFHPHYHVLLALESPLSLDKSIVHKSFSYDYRVLSRLFCTQEIFLQKLWFCLYNNIRLSNLKDENFDSSYSVILDKFSDDDFCELFKYMCKEKAFVEDGQILLTYDYFKFLYESTYRLKQLQGYGVFFSVKDDFNFEEMQENYSAFVEYLSSLSDVVRLREFISNKEYLKYVDDMFSRGFSNSDIEGFKKHFGVVNLNDCDYISFKKYVNFVKNIDI